MGKTIIEKIFSEHVGRDVHTNEEIMIEPDVICAYELPGYVDKFYAQLKELGIEKAKHPERVIIGLDHYYPGGTPEDQEIHKITWEFVNHYGYHIIDGEGISHQVITERFLKPGMIAVHHDAHACLFAALGVTLFPLGGGLIEPLAMESLALICAPTVRINFHGKLRPGVAARDVQMYLLRTIGPSGALNACLELGGNGLINLSMDDRMTICNQTMFVGAKTAVCEQDENTAAYLKSSAFSGISSIAPIPTQSMNASTILICPPLPPMLLVPPHSLSNRQRARVPRASCTAGSGRFLRVWSDGRFQAGSGNSARQTCKT